MSSQLASARYIHQCRTLMERQRQTFDDERALWNIERMELHEKLVHLEATVRQYQGKPFSQVSSPTHTTSFAPAIIWSRPDTDNATTSSGDEFWRGAGGKSDAQPTRTFSESSNQSSRAGQRLPSIAEDAVAQRSDRSFSNISNLDAAISQPVTSNEQVDRNLDGINFKPTGTAPAVVKDLSSLHSPSPIRSPSRLSPYTIPLPSNNLGEPQNPLTKDAGHTPLARRTSDASEGALSDPITPVQLEMERPPLAPRSSVAKIPSERSNSYFPEIPDIDEDPNLKKPLTLHNDQSEDDSFLSALDTKLEAAKTENAEPTVVHDMERDDAVEDQAEAEPKLRIKRSMNFGSQLGSSGF